MRISHLLLLPAVLLPLAAAPLAAQIRLTGTVVDDSTGGPIAGARVELYDYWGQRRFVRQTDADGGFMIELRRAGGYRLRTSRMGYAAAMTPTLWTEGSSFMNVEIRLKSDRVLLAPVTVLARARARSSPVLDNFYARHRSGIGTFFTRDDIERIQPTYLSDLVATVPGMWVQRSGGSAPVLYSRQATRGGRPCPVQIWVDGRLMNPRAPSGDVIGQGLDETVLPTAVEGIEVYRGLSTVPAEFLNQDARCGVVAVWTRRGG
jgi:hypothetical protein